MKLFLRGPYSRRSRREIRLSTNADFRGEYAYGPLSNVLHRNYLRLSEVRRARPQRNARQASSVLAKRACEKARRRINWRSLVTVL
jgi:hypothetical protein